MKKKKTPLTEKDFPVKVSTKVAEAFAHKQKCSRATKVLTEALHEIEKGTPDGWDKLREEMPEIAEFQQRTGKTFYYNMAEEILLAER